jgi:hypothetical protein
MHKSIEERFWEKVDIKSPEECWNWKSGLGHGNYGQFWDGCANVRTNRYAWEYHNKCKVPEGKLILHTCDNPKCCNPKHLYCGTQSNNMQDRSMRSLVPCPNCLCAKNILAIRKLKIIIPGYKRMYKYPRKLVAKKFKVSISTIRRIWNSKLRHRCKEGYFV